MKEKEIFISILILSLVICDSEKKLFFTKLSKTVHEQEAIKIINEMIYTRERLHSLEPLNLMKNRHWVKATKLILDFLTDLNTPEIQEFISNMLQESKSYTEEIKSFVKDKKKNIVKISPVFEWSQDNDIIKIRLKFAKNLESPGEKDIKSFKVTCQRQNLIVHGYKEHQNEGYVTYYYRDIKLYDFMKQKTCKVYKETDGTYIIKFYKNQSTLYWNFLDLATESHNNMYTWFDVFTAYDDKAKYTEFREFAMQNLLEKDINEYVAEKSEDKKHRLEKINKLFEHFRTKDFENKNYCNSPVNEKYCLLNNIYEWNYWLN